MRVLGDDIAQICLFFVELLLEAVIVLFLTSQFVFVVVLHGNLVLIHEHSDLLLFVFDGCAGLELHGFDESGPEA